MAEAVHKLITNKTDAELAAEFKARLVEAYKPILTLPDEIDASGFGAAVQTGKNVMGKQTITALQIVKVF